MTEETTQTEQTTPEDTKPVETKPAEENKTQGSTQYFKDQYASEKAQREKLQAQLEESNRQKLQEQNKWEDLYNLEKNKRETAEQKQNDLNRFVVEDKKMSAIKDFAKDLGMIPEAMEDLDVFDKSMVDVEMTNTGKINVIGAKEFVESLKMKKGYLFKDTTVANINNARPNESVNKTYTPSDLLKLQNTDYAAYQKAVMDMRKK